MNLGDAFVCTRCARQQPYAPAEVHGVGVTEEEAVQMGWERGVGIHGEDVAQATFESPDGAVDATPSLINVRWICPFCASNELRLYRYSFSGFEAEYGREPPEGTCSCGRPFSKHHIVELFANAWWSRFRDIFYWPAFLGDLLWKSLLLFALCHVPVTLRVLVFIALTNVVQLTLSVTALAVGSTMQHRH